MTKLTIQDLDLKNKKVLMRLDLNVPLNKDGTISDDTRIKEPLNSIKIVLIKGGSLILMSHLGRPKGIKESKLSLSPVANRLSELLGTKVIMAHDSTGEEVQKLKQNLKPKEILLLENLRFHKEEEKPEINISFVRDLADGCDVYINDAFGAAHRKHS